MYFVEALSDSDMLFRDDDVMKFDANNGTLTWKLYMSGLGMTPSYPGKYESITGGQQRRRVNSFETSNMANYSNSLSEYLQDMLGERRQELSKLIPLTVIYSFIFVIGVIGNVTTCIVIATKR